MILNGQHGPVPGYMIEGAVLGSRAVALMLGGQPPGLHGDKDQARAATSFIGHVMFTVQIANGLHPSSAVDFIPGDGRGEDLARGFLTAGGADICCHYCGQLMTAAITAAAAEQMRAVHGHERAPGQWEALVLALAGPQILAA